MLSARNVCKSQIELLGIVLFSEFQYFLRAHPSSMVGVSAVGTVVAEYLYNNGLQGGGQGGETRLRLEFLRAWKGFQARAPATGVRRLRI